MTQPLPGDAARTRRDREALDYENATTEAATATLTALLAALAQQLTVAYIRAAGGVQQPLPDDQQTAYRAAVVAALTALADRAGVDAIRQAARWLHAALPAGIRLGADHAQQVTGPVDTPLTVPRELTAAVDDMVINARTDLTAAVKLARVGRLDRYADLTVVTAPAHRAATRVERTARWASTAAVNSGVAQVTDAADVSRIWIAERSACLTCLAYSGHVVGPGQMFPAGLTFGKTSTVTEPIAGPPAHPNCFPAGTIVSGPGIRKTFERWYDGEMVKIRTASGNVLTGTPNHPVLTPGGWVPIGEIYVGADLIRDNRLQAMLARDPDDHQQPALIEDVAGALRRASGVTVVAVPVATEDFHGDGSDGQVDVVRADGLLWGGDQVPQPFGEQEFGRAGIGLTGFPRLRDLRAVLDGLAATPGDGMGGGSQAQALRLVGGRHALAHRCASAAELNSVSFKECGNGWTADPFAFGNGLYALASDVTHNEVLGVPGLPLPLRHRAASSTLCLGHKLDSGLGVPDDDALFDQEFSNGLMRHSELVRQGYQALAGLVALDQVVNVERFPFGGHVYNLETTGGWYIASGIIVHNCRCRAEAWLGSKAGFVDLPEVLKREAQRTVLAGTSAHASNPARVGAADRLLRAGTRLPKTVRARAGIAVRRGRFPH